MKFRFHEDASLPLLSWCTKICHGSATVDVFHGAGVETSDSCFHEGVWSGVFEEREFDKATVVAGSGAKLTHDGVLFVTPSHPTELLYCGRRDSTLYVSNSLVFLFRALHETPDPAYPGYCLDFVECTRRGAAHRPVSIPLRGGQQVDFLALNNFIAQSDLTMKAVPKPSGPPPRSYAQYFDFLTNSVGAIFANASAEQRRHKLRPLATVSEGYDSPAVAALSASLGCTKAMTLVSEYEDGRNVARILGLDTIAYAFNDFASLADVFEPEFFAVGLGTNIPIAAAEQELAGSLLLTGYFGGALWSLTPECLRFAQLPFHSIPGNGRSLIEFRLRVGFCTLPIPTIGIEHSLATNAISRSPEMRPWRVEQTYDRPIPRRIAETSGVPRSLIGAKKHAGGHVYPWDRNAMTSAGRADFLAFVDQISDAHRPLECSKSRQLLSRVHSKLCQACSRLPSSLAPIYLPLTRMRLRNDSHFLAGSVYQYTFHWGVERMLSRYRLMDDG